MSSEKMRSVPRGRLDLRNLRERREHLLTSNAVSVEGFVEIFYHVGTHVGRATDGAILDGLESL